MGRGGAGGGGVASVERERHTVSSRHAYHWKHIHRTLLIVGKKRRKILPSTKYTPGAVKTKLAKIHYCLTDETRDDSVNLTVCVYRFNPKETNTSQVVNELFTATGVLRRECYQHITLVS